MRWLILVVALLLSESSAQAELRAGAAVVDVSPQVFPVNINGGMLGRTANEVVTPVMARALVFDDGQTKLALVVVDSCMMPRMFLDDVKALAATKTEIEPENILIAATHTHTAPASMSCLGTNADPEYVPYLRAKLAEVIVAAKANLEPAEIGWAEQNAADLTAVRRWIRRPDRLVNDPFGNPTVRATMHAGRNWDDVIGESGPEDPMLSLITVRSTSGRPLAIFANFSMHYFGSQRSVAADYFGFYAEGLKKKLMGTWYEAHEPSTPTEDDTAPPFVAMMSHGCSGDIWRRDYTDPESWDQNLTIEAYASELVDLTMSALQDVDYQPDATIAMAESRLKMKYRVPDLQLLEWAERIVAEMGDRPPKNQTEVYAREQLILHEWQETHVVVQAVRIGEFGIATTPTETYALTGLKIKRQSPLEKTMTLDLTNGGDGYIPPPEQHLLGGYNTWAARSAGLEVTAEPRITAAALDLLEQVSGKTRRLPGQSRGTAAESIATAKPLAWWRLDDFGGVRALDSSGNHRDGIFDLPVAFYLAGPQSSRFCLDGEVNRAVHFAGGRLTTRFPELSDQYSISLWVWNGMPLDGREVTGWFYSRGHQHGSPLNGEHLGLGGTSGHAGKLILSVPGGSGTSQLISGKSIIERWTWNHVLIVRDGTRVQIYLNDRDEPEIEIESSTLPDSIVEVFFGGRCDNSANWEGRLDEIAIFDRAITPAELRE